MVPRTFGHVAVRRCEDCGGVFLERSGLGALVEGENDWHAHQPASPPALARITEDMSSPPAAAERSRAFVETLFIS